MMAHGSSPHTRGTCILLHLIASYIRFIPAYAGNMYRSRAVCEASSVHPRIRGEHTSAATNPGPISGSSPHTRGTLTIVTVCRPMLRFIPAYAGNMAPRSSGEFGCPVHPRIRGEHAFAFAFPVLSAGSSPHTRGTLARWKQSRADDRFIPAYAGNMRCGMATKRNPPVHPRIRGEHLVRLVYWHGLSGSSPHTRGTFRRLTNPIRFYRFIPAYAGNIHCLHPIVTGRTVHPRIRGEHCGHKCAPGIISGSSPHTRGTSVNALLYCERNRFIPAYAGNIQHKDPALLPRTVHPRIRGEHQHQYK